MTAAMVILNAEIAELHARQTRIAQIIDKDSFQSLDPDERKDILDQRKHMQAYMACLKRRWERAKAKDV